MYRIIEIEIDGETWYVVYNTIKKVEEARFTNNDDAMSFIIGK